MAPTIDVAVAFANRLIIVGRNLGGRTPVAIELARDGVSEVLPVELSVRDFRSPADCDAPAGARGEPVVACACVLEPAFAKLAAVDPHEFKVTLRSTRGVIARDTVDIGSVRGPDAVAHSAVLGALAEEMEEASADWAALLASALAEKYNVTTLRAGMDHHRVVAGHAFLFHGWVANAAVSKLYFLMEDLRVAVPQEDLMYCHRTDITRLLEQSGLKARTALHGVVVLTMIEGVNQGLVIAGIGEAGVEWFVPHGEPTPIGTGRDLVRDISLIGIDHFSDISLIADKIGAVLERLPRRAVGASVTEWNASDAKPDLSIVVTFYGDVFHLLDHIDSQQRADGALEWLILCDDPVLVPEMEDELRRRLATMRHPTRLIALEQNAGFAAAGNVALQFARGDYIAFMDPNVYWTSFAPIGYARDLMAGDPNIGITGFVLHFEDDTVQHDGMRILRESTLNGLAIAAPDRQGLLSPYLERDRPTTREVDAVTSALMLVRRSDFGESIFDEQYIGRGFEDYDLCLDLKARGKKVVLVEAGGIYHFERPAPVARHVVGLNTCVNGVRFNRKWKREFDAA